LLRQQKEQRSSSSSPLKSYLQIQESTYAFSISRGFHSPMELLLAWSIWGGRRRPPSMAPWPPCSGVCTQGHHTGRRSRPTLALGARSECARLGMVAGARGGGAARACSPRDGGWSLLTWTHHCRACVAAGHSCSTPDPEVSFRRRSFLPNGISMVSTRFGTREDIVPCRRNSFLNFSSLPSLINLPCHHFADVVFHLMKTETTINVPLGLPLAEH
jgi:hypothetical protein